jgi:hypothetical protein
MSILDATRDIHDPSRGFLDIARTAGRRRGPQDARGGHQAPTADRHDGPGATVPTARPPRPSAGLDPRLEALPHGHAVRESASLQTVPSSSGFMDGSRGRLFTGRRRGDAMIISRL